MSIKTGRTLGLMLLGLALAALLAGGAVMTWWRWVTSRPHELPYVPLAVDKTLGINADLSRLETSDRQDALVAMDAAGLRWLRQRFPWEVIEPERGVYDWALWDESIEDTVRQGLKLIAVLDGSPVWARAREDAANPLAPPTETRDFGDFVVAFASRYGDVIDHYQIWDEPNIAPHWGAREIDPAAYIRLLREGAIRIRAADPESVIVTAALAPNVEPGGANMSELLFLDALYQEGAAEWFDVVGAQAYNFEDPVGAAPQADRLNWRRVALLRQVMEAHGDVETAIWAVSFGLSAVPPHTVAEAVGQTRADWPWLGPMVWAAWSPEDVHGQYALTGSEGQPGPVYEALQTLATAHVLAWPGVYPANHPSAQYEGDWRVTPSGADIGGTGDRLTILFRGTRLDLLVRRGDYRAFLFVTVDGRAANALLRDADGRAFVVLYDPLREVEATVLARGLPDGDHVAEIVAERGWGQWAIAGWRVSREGPGGFPWLPIALSLASVVILAATGYRAWSYRDLVSGAVSVFLAHYHGLDDRVILAITAGAALVFYITVGTAPTLAALVLLSILLLLRPEMGLPLIALALPFYQLGRPLLGKVFSMVEILTLLTAVGWLANSALGAGRFGSKDQDSRLAFNASRLTGLDWGVVALVAVGAASLLWADHARVAAREFRTVVLEAGVFYGLLRVMLPARSGADEELCSVWRVADAWVLGGTLIALLGLYQWTFGRNLITAEGVWRVRGFYGSPNNLALYLGKVLPLTVAMVAWGQKERRRWIYGLAALLMALVIFLTYSRGAWVVGVPASLLFLAAMRGRRTLAVAVGLLALVGVGVLLMVGAGRLTSLLNATEGTTFFRLQLWQSSWAMIRDHPLLGVGLDNFLYHYRTYYVLPTAWEEFDLSHPHNLVFDFWLRLGLPGLLVLFWLLVAFFRRAGQAYRQLPESRWRLLILGLMAGMVNLVAHGLVDNAFFLVDLAFSFMLMLALVQAARNE